MAIWILRPQENEQDVVSTDRGTRLYLPIPNSTVNLCNLDDPEIMRSTLEGVFPNYDDQALASEVQVAWAFTHWLSVEDTVIVASRDPDEPISVARIESRCQYESEAAGSAHFCEVQWIAQDIDRSIIHSEVASVFLAGGDFFQLRREADLAHIEVISLNDWEPLPTHLHYAGRISVDNPVAGLADNPLKNSKSNHETVWELMAEEAILDQEPLKTRRLLYAIALSVVVMIVWATFAEVDIVTRGQGKVIPSRQVQILGSQDGGVITEILVREGDLVQQGQLLLKLDQTRSQSSLGENMAERSGLIVRAARLRAMVDGQPFEPSQVMLTETADIVYQEQQLYDSRLEELEVQKGIARQQLKQRREELRELGVRRGQLGRELELATEELSRTTPMIESGAVSPVEVLRLQREVNKAEGELKQTRAQLSRVSASISEAEGKLAGVDLEFSNGVREQLADTVNRINALTEAGAGLSDRVRQTNLLSPVTGTIKQLLYNTVGGIVLPGRDIVELIPADDSLLVEVRVRPQDIAFMAPGQVANVKVTAYDFVVYGGLEGKVEQIGADTVLDEEGNAFYEVSVRTTTVAFGKDQPIIPGMTVEVDILTGKKTIMAYLMKPVLRAQQRSLSER
ncbi:MAG: HlyD family type I secretion periplasmic adaptor subunit [Luminiphilus sp.]|nr:HlyD family type I secretion periplasmic adaptor subunit [Luminiphilus sp.]MDG2494470.1 HlyD family type I secretion periplasmic adaptor subunit [Luminiphilus sp.]